MSISHLHATLDNGRKSGQGISPRGRKPPRMPRFEVSRTLVKSPPELWAELGPDCLEKALGTVSVEETATRPAGPVSTQPRGRFAHGGESYRVLVWRRFRRSLSGMIGLVLVSMLLGGGMSSRLFQEIRERRGLAYSTLDVEFEPYDAGANLVLGYDANSDRVLDASEVSATHFVPGGTVLNLNNMRDRMSDEKAGKNTLVVKLGDEKAKQYHYLLILLAFTFMIMYSALTFKGIEDIIYIIAFIPLLLHLRRVMENEQPALLDPELKKLSLSTFLLAVLFSLGQFL